MTLLRSLAFNAFFYVHTFVSLFVLLPSAAISKERLLRDIKRWARINRRGLEILGGVKVELRGLENIPTGGAIVASKHQSTFETVCLLDLFADPAFVLKKELLSIPIFGWYAKTTDQIPIDRAAGRTALTAMTERAREAMARGRQLVIYPEGTRRPAGAEPSYKHGIVHLYRDLGVPMVPVALDSGLFWPRHGFRRHPGTLVVAFLPQIPPGRDPEEAFADLRRAIEETSDALIAEALAAPNPPPLPAGGRAWTERAGRV